MNQCGACGRRECRKLGLDAVYVEFRDVGVGNVRREGTVAQIDVDEPCLSVLPRKYWACLSLPSSGNIPSLWKLMYPPTYSMQLL